MCMKTNEKVSLNPTKTSRVFSNLISRRAFALSMAVAVLALPLATPVIAEEHYLAPNHPDGIALLPPPPAPGSQEQAADLNSARAVFKGRTPAEEAKANKDSTLAFSIFEPSIGSDIQINKLPKTEALLKKVKAEIGEIIDKPKNHWKRQRPYQVDPELVLGKPEASSSYPSGHSTRGTVYSMVLAEIFPDKKDAILEMGRQIGWDRVLIGKHFPTDVRAGRMLGQAIIRELLESPSFQQDLAAAKAEAQAAKP